MSEWMPIESAPKDGTPVLGFIREGVMYVCWYFKEGEFAFLDTRKNVDSKGRPCRIEVLHVRPTHWMPLPQQPPTKEEA